MATAFTPSTLLIQRFILDQQASFPPNYLSLCYSARNDIDIQFDEDASRFLTENGFDRSVEHTYIYLERSIDNPRKYRVLNLGKLFTPRRMETYTMTFLERVPFKKQRVVRLAYWKQHFKLESKHQ
jgi:hypothetical protein